MSAQAERKTENLPQWKKEEVDELQEIIESYDSVGIVGITGIPSKQLQDMRRDLHGTAELRVSRNTLQVRALEQSGLEDLVEHVEGQVGIVGTNDNPFTLYKELEASKTPAPINEGEVAPNDIVIPEGDTGVDPGPFVGELQSIGANARIEEGSIQVMFDDPGLREAVARKEGHIPDDAPEWAVEDALARVEKARNWARRTGNEFDYELKRTEIPDHDFDAATEDALAELADFIEAGHEPDEIQGEIYETAKRHDVDVGDFFGAGYRLFFDEDQGPKLGPFLAKVDREFVVARLRRER